MISLQINWWAVLSGTLFHFVLGALWYSPLLWAKPWMRLMEMSPDHMKDPESQKRAQQGFLGAFACSLMMSFILACFVDRFQRTTFVDGAALGFLCWIGFVATTSLPQHLFNKYQRPLPLFLINSSYSLVSLVLLGGLFSVWK